MQNKNFWILKEPIDTFFFDCDGTLSLIEGINELATWNGVAEKVRQITERCMTKTGMSPTDYRQRLDYVQPTRQQVKELAKHYETHVSPGAHELIQILLHLNKKVYVISAGIKMAVDQFAHTLGIAPRNVLAVDVYFDSKGNYQGFDEKNNMTQGNGKAIEITSILKPGERTILVGDGITDWEAREAVSRFIGFAGINPKNWVKNHSEFYIKNTSFYPIIPLSLTPDELKLLPAEYYAYYEQGMTDIYNSVVFIREKSDVHYSGSG